MITKLFSCRDSLGRGLVIAPLLVCIMAGSIGCRRSKPVAKDPKKADQASQPVDNAQQLLSNVVGLLTHDVDAATYEAAVAQLNKFVDRRPGAIKDLDESRRQLISQVLGSGVLPGASRKQFSNEDIEFLRNGFFVRTIARKMADSTLAPLDQAKRLFSWTVREISLVPSDWYRSAPPAEVLVRGFGDYRERAWLFLELLRQSDLLGVVVAATTKEKPNELVPWLVGVIVEKEVYLFDPIAGLPVKSPDESASPIATLKQLAADPTLGIKIYGEGGSPLIDPAKIDKLSLLVELEGSMFAPRMAFIENQLSAEDKVNLSVDFNAIIERANATLKEIPNNLGVQVWRFPEEASRGFLAEKMSTPPSYSAWKSRQSNSRVLSIQGESEEAIREMVKKDLAPTVPIIYEVGLKPLEVPLAERRAIMNRLLRATPYFIGLAQWSAHPDDLSYASEWFERYIKSASKWKLQPEDVVDIVSLARDLVGFESKERLPFQTRMFDLLSPEAKEAAKKAAAEKQEPKVQESMRAEMAPMLSIPEPLSEEELSKLGRELNDILGRADLINPETLAKDLGGRTSHRLTMIMAEPIKPDDAEAIGWRNRWAFDLAFQDSVLPADRPWLTGAIERLANCQVAAEKKAEALTGLRAPHPELAPIQRAALRAQANGIDEKK